MLDSSWGFCCNYKVIDVDSIIDASRCRCTDHWWIEHTPYSSNERQVRSSSIWVTALGHTSFALTCRPSALSLSPQIPLAGSWKLLLPGVHWGMLQWCPADEAWDVSEEQLRPGYGTIRIWWLDWRFHHNPDLASEKSLGQLVEPWIFQVFHQL